MSSLKSSNIKVYPNPSYDKLFIEVPQTSKQSTLSLYNTTGQQLLNQQISSPKTELDISSLVTNQRGINNFSGYQQHFNVSQI